MSLVNLVDYFITIFEDEFILSSEIPRIYNAALNNSLPNTKSFNEKTTSLINGQKPAIRTKYKKLFGLIANAIL